MKSALLALGILALTACTNAQTAPAEQAAAPQAAEAVVAEVAGRKITLKEVDERWQTMNPGERARVTQLLYQNRRSVLDQILGDMLIENAAKAANKTSAQFLEEETQKRVTPVTDSEIAQFFEANKESARGRTFEQLREPILQYLTEQKKQQARAKLTADLSSGSAVKVLLEPPRQKVDVAEGDPVRGPDTAAVTIIEYSDFQCPFCARVNPTLDRLRETYGDKIRLVFKDFPLPNHAQAPKASEAAHCAGDQGKFWEMHDRIFANQQSMQVPALKQYAAALGLQTATFDQCLDSGKYASRVAENLKSGEELGISSTPSLFVNGRPVIGAQSFEYFKTVIDEELARK